ncbi:MAG: ABC transporter ATP-binding protein, partial [Clostridiales bacterium]|nr:ABC transporter ATP-binding protein [Clostridiales bacterium]
MDYNNFTEWEVAAIGPQRFYGPPGGFGGDNAKQPWPKSVKELIPFLFNLVKEFFSRLGYIFALIWEASPLILFVMIFMCIFDGVMPVLGAYITKALIDALVKAITGEITSFKVIFGLLIFQFSYLVINRIVNMLNRMITRISGELVVNHIKLKITNKAKTVDLASFDRPSFYEKLENANREAGNRPIQIISATFTLLSTLISMISFIVILAGISPAAPIIIIVLAVPSAIINFVYRKKTFLYMRRRSKERRRMNYYSDILVNKDMVKEVRLLGLSDTFINRYKEVFRNYFAGIKKLIVNESLWHIGITVLSMIVNCLLFAYIAFKVFMKELQVGDYSLYTGALNTISSSVNSLITNTATIYEGTLFIDNMIAFMQEKQTIKPRIQKPVSPQRHIGHKIEFRNVSFRYPGTDRDVLKNINLTLNPGETAVLV